jgi:hypothetical protein
VYVTSVPPSSAALPEFKPVAFRESIADKAPDIDYINGLQLVMKHGRTVSQSQPLDIRLDRIAGQRSRVNVGAAG